MSTCSWTQCVYQLHSQAAGGRVYLHITHLQSGQCRLHDVCISYLTTVFILRHMFCVLVRKHENCLVLYSEVTFRSEACTDQSESSTLTLAVGSLPPCCRPLSLCLESLLSIMILWQFISLVQHVASQYQWTGSTATLDPTCLIRLLCVVNGFPLIMTDNIKYDLKKM